MGKKRRIDTDYCGWTDYIIPVVDFVSDRNLIFTLYIEIISVFVFASGEGISVVEKDLLVVRNEFCAYSSLVIIEPIGTDIGTFRIGGIRAFPFYA